MLSRQTDACDNISAEYSLSLPLSLPSASPSLPPLSLYLSIHLHISSTVGPTLSSIESLLSLPWRPGQLILALQKQGLEVDREDWPVVLRLASECSVSVCGALEALPLNNFLSLCLSLSLTPPPPISPIPCHVISSIRFPLPPIPFMASGLTTGPTHWTCYSATSPSTPKLSIKSSSKPLFHFSCLPLL
jgi:hypothetical protein